MKSLAVASWLLVLSVALAAQDAVQWAVRLENDYRIVPNITYLTASNWDAKLDLYVTRTPDRPLPTLIWIHGGGWTGGTKESFAGLPAYLAMGMNILDQQKTPSSW
jgi:acetyl esterase/lipase